ncbi:THO complex subunit 6 homolog [Brevipalpus obovatus]|uniref:THO complex subunit 6 homolog n=1 Tax=Brevipalpus obovatus TaxID=246614 RepID=UPI003D9E677D
MDDSIDSPLCSRMKNLEQFYTTVLSMSFSDDGKYLIAGLKSGKLAIFMIEKLSKFNDEPSIHDQLPPKPINIIQAHDDAIYSLITIDDLILSAGDGDIKAWRIQNLIESERPKPDWIKTIFPRNSLSDPEINSIIYTGKNTQMIAAGCGDKKIYCYDLESSLPKMVLTGHEDYINCLSFSPSSNLIFSGSEDGSVRLWDLRNGKEVQRIEPFKIQELNRPHGKWIGSVALDTNSDWMVCGGGPHLTSWHVRSLSKGQIYRSSVDSTSNQAIIHENLIISGGNTRYVSVFEMNGDLKIEIPCKPFAIFGLALNVNDRGSQLAVGGCSNRIDVCTNFKYKDFTLEIS